MPVKIDDLKAHIHGNNSLRGSIEVALEGVISRIQSIDSAAGVSAAVSDLRENRDALIDAIFANISGTHTRLGAGETPKIAADDGGLAPGYRADDPRVNADIAESQGNPALPRDASGHKVHPADALGAGVADSRTDPAKAASFGGSGTGAPAADRRDAALAAGRVGDPLAGADVSNPSKTPGQIAAEQRIAERARLNAGQQNGPHE